MKDAYSLWEKRNRDFNTGWKFLNEDCAGAEKIGFDDAAWRTVDLPHDWSVEDYPVQDAEHVGPFFKGVPEGHDVGHLR
ncbi:MAG: hypothetical protein JW860_12745, partial [Sedimentisphaerales bacterium]|nr:hypothetical protein [Sedimentisphaerales bacterium]